LRRAFLHEKAQEEGKKNVQSGRWRAETSRQKGTCPSISRALKRTPKSIEGAKGAVKGAAGGFRRETSTNGTQRKG